MSGKTPILGLPNVDGLIVAVDSESSGLHPDDTATGGTFKNRVSIVSVAWEDTHEGGVGSRAFPFDQGRYEIKNGMQDTVLFTDETAMDANLGADAWRELMSWLKRQHLLMHHAKHDVAMVRAGTRMGWPGYDLLPSVIWDTMLAEWVLTPLNPIGLDATAARMGETKLTEDIKQVIKRGRGRFGSLSNPRYDLIPWEEIDDYARVDAELTLKLWHRQKQLFSEESELWQYFCHEMDVMRVLVGMERRGIGYRYEASLEAAKQADELAKEVSRDLPFDPTPDKAAKWFFETKGALPHCTTEKLGRPSVRECCVRQLRSSPDEEIARVAELYARWSKIDHAIGKYFLGWADAAGSDGRLRTDFRQTGTISLRFSSQRVNLQAIPQDYRMALVEGVITPRALFVAAEGHELWEFDLEQAELRAATSYAGCKRMRELLESEEFDAHTQTAQDLFGRSDKEYRQVAKRCNFALIYSVGVRTFDQDVERNTGVKLGEDRAREVISNWRNLYPEFPLVNQRAEAKAQGRGWVRLWDGRKRYFTSTEMQFELYKAFNQVVQGGIAQLIKRIMVDVDREVPESLILQVHDSLVAELSTDVVDSGGRPEPVELIEKLGSEMGTQAFGIQMEFVGQKWEQASMMTSRADSPYAGYKKQAHSTD